MSRHRHIRNLAVEDFVDELEGYDEEEEEAYWEEENEVPEVLDDEQEEEMQLKVAQVLSILGSDAPVSETEIRNTLWYYYFDVEKSVAWLLEEIEKKAPKQAKTTKAKQPSEKKSATVQQQTAAAQPSTSKQTEQPKKGKKKKAAKSSSSASGKVERNEVSQLQMDIESMHIVAPELEKENEPTKTTGARTTYKKGKINIQEAYKQRDNEKPNINLVVIGHVDAGKSTLLGHILYLLDNVGERAFKKNERDAQQIGRGSFAFAWALDATEEERTRGITMDVAMTSMETEHRRFTLLDAPGHRDFVPRMISGAAQADAAILVVAASIGEFEAGFSLGGQTREHILLARSLGIQQLVVAVNKMDLVSWSESRFNEIREHLEPFLLQTGFRTSSVKFIPCSGISGENLRNRDKKNQAFSWYRGPTLISCIDQLAVPERAMDRAFRLPVVDVFKGGIRGSGGVSVSGRIESGNVQVGDEVMIMPSKEVGLVKAIEVNDEFQDWAVAGETPTITLTGVDMIHFSSGTMLCSPTDPVLVASKFTARVIVFEPKIPITIGFPVVLFHHNLSVSAHITKLHATIDKTTGQTLKKNPRHLPKSCAALIDIETKRPICIETFSNSKDLSRIALRKDSDTIAAGTVMEIHNSVLFSE